MVFAVVTSSANELERGTLDVLGIFDTLEAQAVPVPSMSMMLVTTVRHEYEDAGRHCCLRVELVDEDARLMAFVVREWEVGTVRPGAFGHTCTCVPFDPGLVFTRFGRYRFVVTINDDLRKDVVFQVTPTGPL